MKLVILDGVRYHTDNMEELHRKLPGIRADILGMKAAQTGEQKWFERVGQYKVTERYGTVDVYLKGKKPEERKKESKTELFYGKYGIVPAFELIVSGRPTWHRGLWISRAYSFTAGCHFDEATDEGYNNRKQDRADKKEYLDGDGIPTEFRHIDLVSTDNHEDYDRGSSRSDSWGNWVPGHWDENYAGVDPVVGTGALVYDYTSFGSADLGGIEGCDSGGVTNTIMRVRDGWVEVACGSGTDGIYHSDSGYAVCNVSRFHQECGIASGVNFYLFRGYGHQYKYDLTAGSMCNWSTYSEVENWHTIEGDWWPGDQTQRKTDVSTLSSTDNLGLDDGRRFVAAAMVQTTTSNFSWKGITENTAWLQKIITTVGNTVYGMNACIADVAGSSVGDAWMLGYEEDTYDFTDTPWWIDSSPYGSSFNWDVLTEAAPCTRYTVSIKVKLSHAPHDYTVWEGECDIDCFPPEFEFSQLEIWDYNGEPIFTIGILNNTDREYRHVMIYKGDVLESEWYPTVGDWDVSHDVNNATAETGFVVGAFIRPVIYRKLVDSPVKYTEWEVV